MTNATNIQPAALASAWALFIDAARALTTGVRVVTVAVSALPGLNKEIAKIAKRAAKHSIPAPTMEIVGEEFTLTRVDSIGRNQSLRCVRVIMKAAAYQVAGADFMAALEHTSAGCIVKAHPSFQGMNFAAFRKVDGKRCDHCGVRRNRAKSYVVASADGIKVVGSTCLKDFFGIDVAAAAAWKCFEKLWMALLEACPSDDGEGGGRTFGWATGTADFLARAIYMVAKEGYKPAKFDDSTRSSVDQLLNPSREAMKNADYRAEVNAAGDNKMVAAGAFLRGWIIENVDAGTDFGANMMIAAKCNTLEGKVSGILAYMPEAYRRSREGAIKRAAKAPSVHVGTVGEKVEVSVTVVRVNVVEGYYGDKSIISMVSDSGADITWFKSGYTTVKTGDITSIRGTVKAHDDYKGRPQTVLTRCRFAK